jgi:transposase
LRARGLNTPIRFGRNRRLAKDFENLAETLATFVTLASIQLALRRLARA